MYDTDKSNRNEEKMWETEQQMLTCDQECILSYKLQLLNSWEPGWNCFILMVCHIAGLFATEPGRTEQQLEHRAWSAVWLMSCRSLMSEMASDLWFSYLIHKTEDHDGEGDYQADIIPSGVVTLMFNSLKLSADNELFLAPWLDSAVTCSKLRFDMFSKIYTTCSHFYIEFVFSKSPSD